MQKTGDSQKRLNIPYFSGCNSSVSSAIAKITEFFHCENSRSPKIGVAEKRAGHSLLGNSPTPAVTANFGLQYFDNDLATSNKLYRIVTVGGTTVLQYLNSSNIWTSLSGYATGLTALPFSFTLAEDNFFFANGTDYNKYLKEDGLTVWDGYHSILNFTDTGHLHRCPRAHLINYYNNRLYIGDFYNGAERLKQSLMMSSIPCGIVSLVDGDHAVPEFNVTRGTATIGIGVPAIITALWHGTGHQFITGDKIQFTTDGVLPSGLSASTDYYVIRINATTFYVATTYDNAIADIRITTTGVQSGTHTVYAVASGISTLNVTDTKYIWGDSLQIYRGDNLITAPLGNLTSQWDITDLGGGSFQYKYDGTGKDPLVETYLREASTITISGFSTAGNNGTFVVTGVGTDSFTVTNASGAVESNKVNIIINITSIIPPSKTETALTIVPFNVALQTADEIWVYNTYLGKRLFRWATNPVSGINVKQYDTFKFPAKNDTSELTMMTNVGRVMAIANKNNFGYWNGSSMDIATSSIGCVSKQGYVEKDGLLYFLHYRGLFASNSSTFPTPKTAKVQRIFDGATTAGLEAGKVWKNEDSVFCSIGNSTIYNDDGSVEKILSNVTVEYNVRQNNCFIHIGIDAKFASHYQTATDTDIMAICGSSGNTYSFLDTELDNGAEIPWRVDTQEVTPCLNMENIAFLNRLIVKVDRGSNLSAFISLDGEPFYELSTILKRGVNSIVINGKDNDFSTPPSCRYFQISIRDSSRSIVRISRMSVIFTETMEEESNSN
jgi:hypothetical protein